MSGENSILKTKFFIPQATSDYVDRKYLNKKFEELESKPLMLVSASTGYGKSSVVSFFLKEQSEKCCWLSLSKHDDNFQNFVGYFIKAIQNVIPHFGHEVLELAYAPELPSVDEISIMLINELAELKEILIFAIDDYHLIRNNDIHLFISNLFEYPQPFFRLIIITRRDPELPFSVWRNKNKLIEMRSSDLKFNKTEISEFYKNSLSYLPEENVLTRIEIATEGWISGLRMLLLSSNNRKDLIDTISNFNYKNSRVIKELIDTVLSNQAESTKNNLLKLSILKEFNVELFSELCLDESQVKNRDKIFNDFIQELVSSNMFIISMDEKHSWYRFHHLFAEQLYNSFEENNDKEKVEKLMLKAGIWYEKNDLLADAIEYYLKAKMESLALNVFSEYRVKIISENKFKYLESIYNLFPEDFLDKREVLLVTKGWLIMQKGNIPEMAKHIEPLLELIPKSDLSQDTIDLLLGEVYSMLTFDRYLSNVNIKDCQSFAEKSIKLLNGKNPYALGIAWVYYAAAMQHQGDSIKAKNIIYAELGRSENPILKGQLLIILSFIDWFECDLTSLQISAKHLLQLGLENGIKYLTVSGNIMLGMSLYYQNENEKALDYLKSADNLRHYSLQHMGFPAALALADVYGKFGELEKMEEIIARYEKNAINQGGKLFIKMTKSAHADLNWRHFNDHYGLKWAKENDYKDFLPLASFYSPELVQAKILVQDNNSESLALVQKIINNTIPYFEDRNDSNVLIRSFIIQSLYYYKIDDKHKAFEVLQKSLDLANIGHYYRPYVELGDSMKSLLLAYKATQKENTVLNDILMCFVDTKSKEEIIVLSDREREILILSERSTNKEVGNQLFIAEKTVKSHITNINKKLKVKSKIEAISRAKELDLI